MVVWFHFKSASSFRTRVARGERPKTLTIVGSPAELPLEVINRKNTGFQEDRVTPSDLEDVLNEDFVYRQINYMNLKARLHILRQELIAEGLDARIAIPGAAISFFGDHEDIQSLQRYTSGREIE